MNLKVISRNVGFALLVSALFMFLSILISMGEGNDSALVALAISFIITFTVGIFPLIFVRKAEAISLKDGYMIIVLSWLLSFIFGMLPYVLWGGPFTVVNALFEAVSGYTTTGATILSGIENLPKSLLFWRASTHFIGGLGVVVFLLLIIPLSSPVKLRLSNMELSSLSREGYQTRVNKTVYIFTYVYLGLNLAAIIAYMLAGMGLFDAVCHAFSVCSTGGFSTKNNSIAGFNSLPVNLVTMLFMFLASVHFGMLFMAIVSRSFKPFNNSVFKVYSLFLIIASLLVAFTLKGKNIEGSWGMALMNGSFHVLSYTSTTGFAIADNRAWPYFVNTMLQVCGICCGMAGSTTGGLKMDRVVILWNAIIRHIYRSVHPASVSEIRISGHVVKDEDIYPHILYIALYFFIIIISLLACLLSGVDNANAFMATLSTLGNVGPAIGDLGTFGNYNIEPDMAKISYCINMFLGRVEIYPVFSVIYMLFASNKKLT